MESVAARRGMLLYPDKAWVCWGSAVYHRRRNCGYLRGVSQGVPVPISEYLRRTPDANLRPCAACG